MYISRKLFCFLFVVLCQVVGLRAEEPTYTVQNVALSTNHLVYEPFSRKIFATVPGSVGSNGTIFGNSVTPINPVNGTVGSSVFVGSEPGRVVATNNGQYLYIATASATNIVRYDLAKGTSADQFSLGMGYGPLYAEDLETVPGLPETVTVARANRGLSPRHEDIAVYDNGLKRPMRSAGVNVIEWNDSGTRLYGYFNEITSFDFVRWDLATNGLVNGSVIHPMTGFGIDIRQSGGRIYGTNGQIFDPETGTQIGTFPGGTFVPDAKVGRVFALTQSNSNVTIRAFDTQTLLQTGTITIPIGSGTATQLIRWGRNGLAFRTVTAVYLVQTNLVPDVTPEHLLAITDQRVVEGDTGQSDVNLSVSLSEASSNAVTVRYATTDGTAVAGSDYISASGDLIFEPGETQKTISLKINGDIAEEVDESFAVQLSLASGATILDGQGRITIVNDDVIPDIHVNDVSVNEGGTGSNTATFTISLSQASRQTVTVNYATSGGTATANNDYSTASGTLTFNPGQTSMSVPVTVLDDGIDESNETFLLNLSGASNGNLVDASGEATIVDDDVAPTVYIEPVSVQEGDHGSTQAEFRVSLSWPATAPGSINYSTQDGTAQSPADYQSTFGTLNFAAGESSKLVSVPVKGDTIIESNKRFSLILSNPINLVLRSPLQRNPDNGHYYEVVQQPLIWMAAKAAAQERAYLNARGHLATVSSAIENSYLVNRFYPGAGLWLGGFQPINSEEPNGGWGWVTGEPFTYTNWNPGEPNQVGEEDFIQIGNSGRWNDLLDSHPLPYIIEYDVAPGFTGAPSQAEATIIDDDTAAGPLPSFTISDINFAEGQNGPSSANFTVSLSSASNKTATVQWATQDDTATAGSDYATNSGVLTFEAGEAQKTVSISVLGDHLVETDETFLVVLTNPVNSSLADTTGFATIRNDDHAPVAVDDATLVNEDDSIAIAVLNNDTDADGDILSVESVVAETATRGKVTLEAGGVVRYVPEANFAGTAAFSYRVTDNRNGIATARVFITVRAVNDTPVALDNVAATREDTILTQSAPGVLDNDTDIDGDALTARLEERPQHGILTLEANGQWSYSPSPNYHGTDSWTYKVVDGQSESNLATVRINVVPVPDAPLAVDDIATTPEETPVLTTVLANDGDADGDALRVANVSSGAHGTTLLNGDGSILYSPERDFAGTDSFSYRIIDATGSDSTATVTITVTDVAEVPAPTPVPSVPTLSLTVAPASFAENAGAIATNGIVQISFPVREATLVAISAVDARRITVPAHVIIPAGSTQASFTIGVVDDRIYTGSRSTNIQVTIPNLPPVVATLTVIENERAVDFQPRISWISPRPAYLTSLGSLEGTVAGSSAGGTTGLKVSVAIQRFDGAYYNGRGWGAVHWLPTTVSAGRWKVPLSLMPPVAVLRNGRYNLIAQAELPYGSQKAYVSVIIDRTAPKVSILTPVHRSNVSRLNSIAGQAADELNGSGITQVLLSIRRLKDGQYWSGYRWGTLPLTMSNPVKSGRWTRSTLLPSGMNLLSGYHHLTATTIDRAGNRASYTSVVLVKTDSTSASTSRQNTNQDATSRVVLSSSAAESTSNRIELSWTGALDVGSATDMATFSVVADGKVVAIESVAYEAANNRVFLQLPEESLAAGSVVNVVWRGLRDAQQQLLPDLSTSMHAR